ncbi:hypothetical protein ABH920_001350 [Catenulispora sp. EB89]
MSGGVCGCGAFGSAIWWFIGNPCANGVDGVDRVERMSRVEVAR